MWWRVSNREALQTDGAGLGVRQNANGRTTKDINELSESVEHDCPRRGLCRQHSSLGASTSNHNATG